MTKPSKPPVQAATTAPFDNDPALVDRRADSVTGVGYPVGTHPDGPDPTPHPTGRLVADRCYSRSPADRWALPARVLGYEPVIDHRPDRLGVHGEHKGAVLVDGRGRRRGGASRSKGR